MSYPPPATEDQMAKLAPYLASEMDRDGEIDMHCPLHGDVNRSARLNPIKGMWWCAVCGGSSIRRLIDAEDTWVAPPVGRVSRPPRLASPAPTSLPTPTLDDVRRWYINLQASDGHLKWLWQQRHINRDTVKRARIGWNDDRRVYTIPVFSPERRLWNVRYYDMRPSNGRRKIWSHKGMGHPRLYPIGVLNRLRGPYDILFCEGEWDTLLALQLGFTAVTRTGSAKVWLDEWTPLFEGHNVYLCHDADFPGQEGNKRVASKLADVAEVRVCRLPFPIVEDHGQDLTDYVQANNGTLEAAAAAVSRLMDCAECI